MSGGYGVEPSESLEALRARLRELTSELALAEERERRRVARGLHDEVGHSLALARIRLESLAAGHSGEELASLLRVRDLIAEAIEGVRSLTFDLSSPVLYEVGLAAAVEGTAERIAEAAGLEVEFQGDGGREPPEEDRRVLVFRFVRELLLNAAKHAGARSLRVTMRTVEDRVHVTVEDDGVGFDPDEVLRAAGPGVGHGLRSVAAQVRAVGGRLEVASAPGEGTACRIEVPLDGD